MKKLFLSFFLIGCIFISNAQSDILTYGDYDKNSYNRLTIGYDNLYFNNGFHSMMGVNLSYMHGFKIIESPLFIELGVSVSYNTRNYNEFEEISLDDKGQMYYNNRDKRLNSLSARVPVNISYNIKLSEKFSIQPYTGINFKVNPLFDYEYHSFKGGYDDYGNYYEKNLWQTTDNKLFQLGWQIGVGFNFSRLYLGIQYGLDFMDRAVINEEIYSYPYEYEYGESSVNTIKLKSSQLLVNLGINF